jgi:enolase
MTAIIDIHAREILDSRGNPTVEVDALPRVRTKRSSCAMVTRSAISAKA